MTRRDAVDLTSVEALGVAIRSEMDSRDIYRELAERFQHPITRRRFELLAAEEEQHLQHLTERYEEVAGGVPLAIPSSQLPKTMASAEARGQWDMADVLDMAIEEERRSREFYLQAARDTNDLSGRAMFRFLADMEYLHWMTLAQEKDLLVRYPNYGRPGRSPWRAEKKLAPASGKGGDPHDTD
jgi:rubrerythrin